MNPDTPGEPDDYQRAWNAQSSQVRLTVDASLLQTEVERSQRAFHSSIFARDAREVGVALVMLPVWFFLGDWMSLPWTWYLTPPALIWVAGVLLVDRRRHPQRAGETGDPLLASVREGMLQVEHQIGLLRNVFWWYLLPFLVATLAFFCHVVWLRSQHWGEALGQASYFCGIDAAICWFLYYLNQRAVRTHLEPRRRELLTLLASLGEDSAGAATAGDWADAAYAQGSRSSGPVGRPMTVLALLTVGSVAATVLAVIFSPAPRYEKRAPFRAVRWQGNSPVVKIDEQWLELQAIDGIAIDDVVQFSQRTYSNWWRQDLWRKRFAEDLVEVLTRMGSPPGPTVRLVASTPGSALMRTLDNVPMTGANRDALYTENSRRDPADSTLFDPGPIDPTRLEGTYQLTPNFVFDVRYVRGRLMVGITNQATQRVLPVSSTIWTYGSVAATLEFHVQAEGPAYALTLHQNGAAQRARRVGD